MSNLKSNYVKADIGVDGRGNCLPGPYRPFGMVRLSPDIDLPQPSSGYCSTEYGGWAPVPIRQFSHTHVAGTGGCSRYGNIGIMPFCGEERVNVIAPIYDMPYTNYVQQEQSEEKSEVGYYTCIANPHKIKCELTTTQHVGLHRYTFPENKINKIILNAGSVVHTGLAVPGHVRSVEKWDSEGTSTGGYIEWISKTELAGRSDFIGGWGHDKPYSVFFFIKSAVPFTDVKFAHQTGMVKTHISSVVNGAECQAVLSFPDSVNQIQLQVGISFVSVAKARGRLRKEIGEKTFNDIICESRNEWDNWFNRIRVSGGKEKFRKLFYSLMYRLLCMPTDMGIDDENPHWESGKRQFWDYYCLWDSVRNANSLFLLFAPELYRDMINGMLDVAEHTGWLPDAYIAGHHAYVQGGCSADIIFAESAAKGIEGVDYERALHFMKKNNLEIPPDPIVMGRVIEDYKKLGYCSNNTPTSVSRHIEYTYHDWCIASLAKRLGDTETEKFFIKESEKIWNLWDEKRNCFAAKNPDGSWNKKFDPDKLIKDCWNDPFCYEGTSRHWTLSVFQDFYGMIEKFGGNAKFAKYLDKELANGMHVVKETRMHYPWLFIYAGRPDLTARWVHDALNLFTLTRKGIPDNEDMGCQSGFYMWSSMGIYPIIGQDIYLLTTPLFEKTELDIGFGGKTLIITTNNPGKGKYIQSATLNGKPLSRAWLKHSEIANGAEINFICSNKISKWGREELPPNGI